MSENQTQLQPHQQRVLAERNALNEDLTKLRAFIGTETFQNLQETERNLLNEQEGCMSRFLNVLNRRLNLWGVQ